MKFNLNRSFNVFEISRDTPTDLIIFLMRTTGKNIDRDKVDKKFEKIKTYLENYEEYIEIKDNYDHSELNKITTYVTDMEEPWSVRNLLSSFDQLTKFHTKFILPEIDQISFGSKTNDNPLSYDICMCYIVCIRLGISVSNEDTIDTLKDKIISVSKNREKNYELLKKNINKLNALELYNMTKNLDHREDNYSFKDTESLEKLAKNINLSYIIRNSILNNEEAVVYAAKFFNYDISESSSPVSALKCITEKKDEIVFTFEDDFTRIFQINSKYYKLDKFWRKNIKFLYSPKTTSSLKEYENLDDEEDLDRRYSEDNYYDGIYLFDSNQSSLENKGNVTFGNINSNSVEIIDIRKLMEIFKENLSFGKYETNIEKLVNICKENKDSDYTSLYRIIRFIQKYCLVTNEDIKQLKNLSEKHKVIIKEIFEKLMEVSNCLKDKEKVDDFSNISIMNNILNLNKYLSDIKNPELKSVIEKIPIINYKNDKFCKPNDSEYINIVEDLSNTKNLKDKTAEYLKNKSRYYAYSSYYYIYIFYKESLFDLEKF